MTLAGLALANLRLSPVTSALNVLLLALGSATIVLLLLLAAQVRGAVARDAGGIDLVLGAKGSPVQLILAAVHHADVPSGNIPFDEAARWARDARVALAVPLLLGDSFRGFRIVGTTPDYLALYRATAAEGRLWGAPMEAVLGASVAAATGLGVGASFVGAHGLTDGHAHEAAPYRVAGVLAPTGAVIDRLILTGAESVWQLHEEPHAAPVAPAQHPGEHADGHAAAEHGHEHEHGKHEHDGHDHEDPAPATDANEAATPIAPPTREITAMLLRYASPIAATTLPREVNQQSPLQAAAPAQELSRLLQRLGTGLDVLAGFAALLIACAALSIFAALYGALRARRQAVAVLRCLGATRGAVLWSLLLEGLLLTAAGAAVGLALGHGAAEVIGQFTAAAGGLPLTGLVWLPEEALLLAGLLLLGIAAAALPAWQACRAEPATVLAAP